MGTWRGCPTTARFPSVIGLLTPVFCFGFGPGARNRVVARCTADQRLQRAYPRPSKAGCEFNSSSRPRLWALAAALGLNPSICRDRLRDLLTPGCLLADAFHLRPQRIHPEGAYVDWRESIPGDVAELALLPRFENRVFDQRGPPRCPWPLSAACARLRHLVATKANPMPRFTGARRLPYGPR